MRLDYDWRRLDHDSRRCGLDIHLRRWVVDSGAREAPGRRHASAEADYEDEQVVAQGFHVGRAYAERTISVNSNPSAGDQGRVGM
jgi:hypothetical protein